MNENFKKMLAEALKDAGKNDMEAQLKEAAQGLHLMYESFVDAGFNEIQAMSLVLEIVGGALH